RRALVSRMGVSRHAMGRRRQAAESNPLSEMVAHALRRQLQNAHAGHPWATGLPIGSVSRNRALHHTAALARPFKDALLSGRGPLGAQTAKQPALEQDRERLVRSVDRESGFSLRYAVAAKETAQQA